MSSKEVKVIIFADLDGSILDEKYQYRKVEHIFHKILSLKSSVVFASSKTRSEIDFYRNLLGIIDPYIVENGSAIIVPNGYFQFKYKFTKHVKDYDVIQLGLSYEIIRERFSDIKKNTSFNIIGFGDMTLEQLAKDSGLPMNLSKFAKDREYSEPFRIIRGNEPEVTQAIFNEGLCFTKGGRYFHLLGNCDKGKATSILRDLFSKKYDKIFTIGVGDSDNDLTMLKVVDAPFYVGKNTEKETVWKDILKLVETF